MFHFPLSWLIRRHPSSTNRTKRSPEGIRPKFFVDLLEDRTLLNAYLVNVAGDVGTGTGLTGDIRYAVTQANANPGSTISFDTTGTGTTILLTHGELAISADVAISGPGLGSLTINGASGGSASRIFDVTAAAATVSISGLTITGGNGSSTFSATAGNQGGDLLNAGKLTLTNDVVSSGSVVGVAGGSARGGGIFNASGATLTLSGTTFKGDTATGGAGAAGAVGAAGGVGGSALGGGVFNSGTLSITGGIVTGNVATGGAGGLGGDGTVGTTGATGGTGGNGGPGGAGGRALGGGVYSSAGALMISDTNFTSNQVQSGSGGNGGAGGVGGAGTASAGGTGGTGGGGGSYGDGRGGAIFNSGGDLTITNGAFTANTVNTGTGGAGGIGGDGGVGTTTAGSGGTGGTGGGSGGAISAQGGGISNSAGNMTISGSTFTHNQVTGGAGGKGGVGGSGLNGGSGGSGGRGETVWGGGVASSGTTLNVTITNTDFTGNVVTSGAGGAGAAGGAADATSGTGGHGGSGGRGGSAWGGGLSYHLRNSHTPVNTVSISGGSFTGNSGVSSPGGPGGTAGTGNIGGVGGAGADSRDTWGGGFSVYDQSGPTNLVVSGSPVSGNSLTTDAGGAGGAGGFGTTTGGAGGNGGRADSPWGGGISVSRAFNVTITNSPISNNSATGSTGGIGGVGGGTGAGGTGGKGGNGGNGFSAWGGGISIDHNGSGFNGSSGGATITNSPVTSNRVAGSDGGAGGPGGVPFSGGTGGRGGNGGNGGSAWGGGILDTGGNGTNPPGLAIVNSPVTQNSVTTGRGNRGGDGASAGIGGAGGNGGQSNQAWGGGISVDRETLTLDNSPVSGNSATVLGGGDGGTGGAGSTGAGGTGGAGGVAGSAYGGGISNDSTRNIQINASDIIFNSITQSAGGAGGAGGAGATTGGNGGSGATANKVQGGGIYQNGGTLEILDSTFAGNVVTGGGGGAGGIGGAGGSGAGGGGGAGGTAASPQGGAVYDLASGANTLSIVNSTFGGTSANPSTPDVNRNILIAGAGGAGGAAGASGSGGSNGGAGGAGGSPQGGAIFVANAITASLTNDTITANEATSGAGGAGGAATGTGTAGAVGVSGTGTGGGFYGATTGTGYVIGNTIIALNSADAADPDVHGLFASAGHNVIGTVGTATGFVASDTTGVTASQLNLGPLLNNGGTTLTDALLGGSIAADAGDNAILPLLPPPNNLILSTSATGGTLAAASYAYRITAINAQGETLPSPELSITIASGTTNTVTIVWPTVAGATGYKVYGRTAGSELLLTTVAATVNSFTDDGSLTPAGALPTTNTATLTTDQRGTGFNRIVNSTIDVGAFETQILPPLVVSGLLDGSALAFTAGANGKYNTTPSASGKPFADIPTDVRSAVGDVNGDGVPDLIFVTGPGVPILVDVISGVDNKTVLVQPFDPFGGGFTGGGFVAAADFDRDGRAEFIVTPDRGGGPRVSIFSRNLDGTVATRANYFTIDPNFRGGARVAAGDVNGDGVPDLVIAAGFGGGPRIAVINGKDALTTDGLNPADRLVNDFFAFDPALRNGTYVAVGDLDGDGFGDLVFGAGPGGGPRVLVVSGKNLLTDGAVAAIASPISNFFVNGTDSDRSGVRVAVVNADNDSKADVAVATGEQQPSRVRVYLGKNFGSSEPTPFQDLNPYGSIALADGVFVG